MTDEIFTFEPPRTRLRLLSPWIVWGILILIGWIINSVMNSIRGAGPFDDPYALMILSGLACGAWFVGILVPPILVIDRAGITWKRRWLPRRFIPWIEVQRVSTGTTESFDRYGGRQVTRHIEVVGQRRKIRIKEGMVVEYEDLARIAGLIDEASRCFGIGIRVNDWAEVLPQRETT